MSEKEETVDKRVEVRVILFQPFYDFMKEYLAFFGSKQTIEQFCMSLIYDRLSRLYRELRNFVSNRDNEIDRQAWFERWPHIATVCDPEPEEEDC